MTWPATGRTRTRLTCPQLEALHQSGPQQAGGRIGADQRLCATPVAHATTAMNLEHLPRAHSMKNFKRGPLLETGDQKERGDTALALEALMV